MDNIFIRFKNLDPIGANEKLNEYKKTESILTEQYEMKTWNQ
jgi:hypothetical protein